MISVLVWTVQSLAAVLPESRTSALKAMGLVLVTVSPHRVAFGCKRIPTDPSVAQSLGTEEF